MELTDLSVIIFNRENPGGLIRLLESLESTQSTSPAFDVVLVYCGLNKKVQTVLEEHQYGFKLQLIGVAPNTTDAVALNIGSQSTQAKILHFLDSNLEVSPELLSLQLKAFENQEIVAVMGEQFLPPFVKKSRWYRFLDSEYGSLRRWAREGQTENPPLRYVNTANFSVRRSAFLACGGFDETMVNREAGDIDLAHRIKARTGKKIIYSQEAIAYRQHPPLKVEMNSRFEFGRDGIPGLVDKYPELYHVLPSRFIKFKDHLPTSVLKQATMQFVMTRPALLLARALRLIGPEALAFWMFRYMLQYHTIQGIRQAASES